MNQTDKLQFVCSLTESIKNQFADALRAGEVPENWDGHEIRQWLADKFAAEVYPSFKADRKRMREYRNDVMTSSRL